MEDGIRLYKSGKFGKCRTVFNKAYHLLSMKKTVFEELSPDAREKYVEQKIRCTSNCAQVLIKQLDELKDQDQKEDFYNKIIEKCDEVLKFDPKNVKAFYRKAMMYKMKKDPHKGFELIKTCVEIQPKLKMCNLLYKELEKLCDTSYLKEKFMCQNIFKNWEAEKEREIRDKNKAVEMETTRKEEMSIIPDENVGFEDGTEEFLSMYESNCALIGGDESESDIED